MDAIDALICHRIRIRHCGDSYDDYGAHKKADELKAEIVRFMTTLSERE